MPPRSRWISLGRGVRGPGCDVGSGGGGAVRARRCLLLAGVGGLGLASRLGPTDGHVIPVADERQPDQVRVSQEPLRDPRLIHPQVSEAGLAIRPARRVEQRGRAQPLDEATELTGCDRALAQVDE